MNLDEINYKQLVINLTKLTVDLAIENSFYKRQIGEIAVKQHPDFVSRFQQFQPPLGQFERNLAQEKVDFRQIAADLQGILSSISRFLEA